MPAAQKPEKQAAEKQGEDSMLKFIPAGMPRIAAEYAISIIVGAVLFFAFFFAAEALMLLNIGGDIMAITFLPVICLLPMLCGAISVLALEKLCNKPVAFKSGAAVAASAGLLGALVSAVFSFSLTFMKMKPFGSVIAGTLMVAVALIVMVGLVAVLSALGGAIAVKFTNKETPHKESQP